MNQALPQASIPIPDNEEAITVGSPDVETNYVVITADEDTFPAQARVVVWVEESLEEEDVNLAVIDTQGHGDGCGLQLPNCPQVNAEGRCLAQSENDGSLNTQVPAAVSDYVSLFYLDEESCEEIETMKIQVQGMPVQVESSRVKNIWERRLAMQEVVPSEAPADIEYSQPVALDDQAAVPCEAIGYEDAVVQKLLSSFLDFEAQVYFRDTIQDNFYVVIGLYDEIIPEKWRYVLYRFAPNQNSCQPDFDFESSSIAYLSDQVSVDVISLTLTTGEVVPKITFTDYSSQTMACINIETLTVDMVLGSETD